MEYPAGEEGLDEATYFDMEREKAAKAASATKAKSKESKSRQNFKVIIRVRPPLDVEIEREQAIYRRINEDGYMRLSSEMRSYGEPGPSVVVEQNKVITLFERRRRWCWWRR